VHCTNSGERMKRNGISKLLDLTNRPCDRNVWCSTKQLIEIWRPK